LEARAQCETVPAAFWLLWRRFEKRKTPLAQTRSPRTLPHTLTHSHAHTSQHVEKIGRISSPTHEGKGRRGQRQQQRRWQSGAAAARACFLSLQTQRSDNLSHEAMSRACEELEYASVARGAESRAVGEASRVPPTEILSPAPLLLSSATVDVEEAHALKEGQ
jgi:hypothetical protein